MVLILKQFIAQGKAWNKSFFYCLFLFVFSILFVSELISSELVNLSSSSWEREASIEAHKRYHAFCELNSKMLKKELKNFPSPNKPLSKALEKKYRNDPFIVFSKSINEKTFKYVSPDKHEVNIEELQITSARNEWESIQIGIWALTDLKNFSYEVSDLTHENGTDTISGTGTNMRKYFVYNIFTRKEEAYEITPDMDIDPERINKKGVVFYQEEPVILMDLPGVDIKLNTAQAIWLDIFVPKGTVAGKYRGNIYFKIDGEIVNKKAFLLTVDPFELDEAKDWARGAYISKFIDKKEAINLLENGHNQVSWWTTGGYKIGLQGTKIVADFSPFVRYLKKLDSVGMTGPHVVFLGGDSPKLHNKIFSLLGRKGITNGRNIKYRNQYPSNDLSAPFETYLTQVLKQYYQQMKASGHGDIVSVLLDEPDHRPRPERLDWYNKTFAMVEKKVPELPTMGVFYHEGDEKKISHHHAVWSTNRPSMDLYNACKKAGKKLYTYHGGFKFYDEPGKYRFDIGIIPWVYDAKGTFYWAIWNRPNSQRYKDDIFLPDTFTGRATTIARAPKDAEYGPLSTLVHKGFREAVDDARYIKTLEQVILQAKDTSGGQEAKKHEKWLDHIKLTLRKKLYVRGGHVYNHKRFVDWRFPVASLTFKNSLGEKCSLENLSIFLREDVRRRIISLRKAKVTCFAGRIN